MSTADWVHYPAHELREDQLGNIHRINCRCGQAGYWYIQLDLAIASYAEHHRHADNLERIESTSAVPVHDPNRVPDDIRGVRHVHFRRHAGRSEAPAPQTAPRRNWTDRLTRGQ